MTAELDRHLLNLADERAVRQQDAARLVLDYLLRDCITVIYDAYLTEDGGNGDDAVAVLERLYALFGETIPPCSCGNPDCDGH